MATLLFLRIINEPGGLGAIIKTHDQGEKRALKMIVKRNLRKLITANLIADCDIEETNIHIY